MTTETTIADALISECGLFRWWLTRIWDDSLPVLCFCQLNPSTADAKKNDPTIRKDMAFGRLWGYGGICGVNVYAFRATEPNDMLRAIDPVGPENDRYIAECVKGRDVIAAWGGKVKNRGRIARVTTILQEHALSVKCLGYTQDGHPLHPLYMPYTTERVDFPRVAVTAGFCGERREE